MKGEKGKEGENKYQSKRFAEKASPKIL